MLVGVAYTYGCIPDCPGYFYGASYAMTEFSGLYTSEFETFGFSYQNKTDEDHLLSLSVYDYTTSTYLFNQSISEINGAINIDTEIGHDIGVEILYSMSGDGYDYEKDRKHNILTYNMNIQGVPVVPEPISSTLFIIGGMALGFRQFRKNSIK